MIDFKPQTCCITGHRDIPPEEERKIITRLRYQVEELYYQGYRYFGVGGALGFDTLAAKWLIDYRKEKNLIRIIEVLPFEGYRNKWTEIQQIQAAMIDQQIDKIVYCSQEASKQAFLVRDRHLVDCSSAVSAIVISHPVVRPIQ